MGHRVRCSPVHIPSDLLEKELVHFGKFASGFIRVRLGCKDAKFLHVLSLWRQAFMYLSNPSQMLEVSFKVNFENGFYTVYASAGSMKFSEGGDVAQGKPPLMLQLIGVTCKELTRQGTP